MTGRHALRTASTLLWGALALAACRGEDPAEAPRPLSVTPDRGPVSTPVEVVIRGENFHARVATDFTGSGGDAVDARFAALLGQVPLDGVRLQADGSLVATVPPGLATGSYDLTVVDPEGRRGTLAAAYRVLPDGASGSPVASFRIDPLGPQRAMAPFAVVVTALDVQGQPVADFNGTVQLGDLTGTAVPGSAGLFAAGRWSGLVEVRAAHAADVLTASDGLGHSGQSAPFLVAPSPAAGLRFLTPPRTGQAGDCSGAGQPLAVGVFDAFGAPTQAEVDLSLALAAAPPAGFEFYTDAACTVPAAPVLPAGASSATFWFRGTRAGAISLTASAPSLQGDSQSETVTPAAPAAVVFVTTPETVNAGACSQAVTLEVQDAFGNPSPPGGIALELAASAGGFTLHADAACSVPATAATLASGATRASFWFSGTTAQVVTVTAGSAALGLAPAWQDEIVLSEGSATQLVILTPPQSVSAGTCSDLVAVQAQDSFGNAVAGAGAEQLTLSAAPAAGMAFFSDPACSVPAAVVQIGAGQSTTSFWFSGTAASAPGGVAVTAGSATLTDAVQAETVTPGPPARLEFASAPMTVAAGACSGLATVRARDAFGNASPSGVALPVDLAAAPAAGVSFFADALCAAPVAQVAVPAGSSLAVFAFKAASAGTETLTASAAGLTPASQDETVRAATPDRLVFTSAPQAVAAGACSGAATVQARDPWGNPAPVPAAAAVALAAAPVAGFGFFGDAACTAPLGSVTIPAGQTGATFFFAGTAAGSVTVTASAAGWTPATQAEAVGPAGADHLVFLSAPQTVIAGACSGAATVESRDAFENPVPLAGGATVALAAAPAAGFGFYAGAGCAGAPGATVLIAPGASTATFSFRGTAAGSVTVTASSPPLAPIAQAETVAPAPPDRVAFASAPQTVTAGQCSALVMLRSQDAYGNASTVAAAAAVALSAAPPSGFGFYADAGCTSAVGSVTIAAGSSSAGVHFRGTAAGSVAVTATPVGLAPASQTETVTALAAPSQLVFLSAPQAIAAGACSARLTVQAQDSFGNPQSPAGGATVALAATPAAGLQFYSGSDPTCAGAPLTGVSIASGDSTADFFFRSTAAGGIAITASSAPLNPTTQTETVDVGPASRLAFMSAPQTRQAGACSALATVQSLDAFGNASSVTAATAVTLSAAPASGFGFYTDAGCTTSGGSLTIAAGASTASFYFKGTAPGSVTVTASVTGWGPSPTQVETVNPAPPDHLAFGTAPQGVVAGACSAAATVETRDPYGNVSPVSAATTVNLTASPATGFGFYSDAACTAAVPSVAIPATGTIATFYFKGTAAGSVAVTAAAAGMSPSPTQVQTVAPAAPDRLVFTGAPQTLKAGACSAAATLQSRDAYGNTTPVSAATTVNLLAAPAAGFGFYADAICSVPAATTSFAAGQSAAGFYFRGTAVGGVTATASVTAWTASASQVETIDPGDPDRFAWDAIASPQASNIPFAVTVRALDAFGNAAPAFTGAAALTLSVSPPLSPAPVVTCTSGCIVGNATGAFTAGVWTGSVAVGSPATPEPPGTPDRALVATSGPLTGPSGAFAVQGAKNPSPPVARFTASPVVIRVNQSVTFDASGCYDYETPVTLLQASWDFQGTSTGPPAYPAPAAPWTAWSTTKTAVSTYTTAGTYYPRLAVRDEAGAVSYATVRVVVLAAGSSLCVVNTAADVDDGAGSCACAGAACGTDQKLSLAEALRLSTDGTTITFAGPMTITGSGSYTTTRNVEIVAPPGVVLDSKSLNIRSGDSWQPLVLAGLEFTRQTTPILVASKRFVVFEDVYFHDLGTASTPAIEDRGTVTLTRVRMANCASSCVLLTDSTNSDTLTVRYSDFRGAGGVAIDAQQCKAARLALSAQSNAFSGFAEAVRMGAACPGFSSMLNNTFEANGTGVAYPSVASPNHTLRNNVFTSQTVASASCGLATFTSRDYHVLFGNASNGCLGGDPSSLASDPQYVFPAARDYRLQLGSPATDSAVDLGLYLLPAFPAAPGPRFLGAGPDRGGRESF